MRYLIKARNAVVAVDGERIVDPYGRFDAVIEAPRADVAPGLVNSHDHLHRNHYGRLGRPPYSDASAWATDIQLRYRRRIAAGRSRPRREALLRGAWKNLFSGVTTVVHHDAWEPDFDRNFPIRVARIPSADSVRSTDELTQIDSTSPYSIHVAEAAGGTGCDDVGVLAGIGLLSSNLLAVHCVGLDDASSERLRASGAAVVWCPTSNVFMLGKTAPAALLGSGIDVLLGSDSLLTGSGNLLDEIRFARAHGPLDDEAIERSVRSTATARLGLPAPTLEPGSPADLILIDKAVVDASADDISLVVAAGIPRVATFEIARTLSELAPRGQPMTVGSVTRWTNPELPKPGTDQ